MFYNETDELWYGLNSERLVAPNGKFAPSDKYYEYDTSNTLIFNGSSWVPYSRPVSVVGSLPNQSDALVKIPFSPGEYSVDNAGSSVSYQNASVYQNEDGTNTGILITVPSGINGVQLRFPFYGRVFGIRFRKYSSGNPDFSVALDGVAYGPISGNNTYYSVETNGQDDNECLVVIDNNLPDTIFPLQVHYAEITITSPPSGSSSILLYGYLVEARVGYTEKPKLANLIPTVALTTTPVSILSSSMTDNRAWGARKVTYYNTTASPVTVTIKNYSNVMWSTIIPANSAVDYDFGMLTGTDNSITHFASAVGVNATVIGGY